MAGISIFFPIYNDEKVIQALVDKTRQTMESITEDYEIILVNDASFDNSAKVCDELSQSYEKIKVIHHPKNQDYGGALKSGFYAASKDLIFYTDADGQYDVAEIKKLLPLIKDNDVVTGYKIKRKDRFFRVILGDIYRAIVNTLFNLKVRDVTCDFRLFRKEAIKSIKLYSNSGFICVELMKEIQNKGYRISQVAVTHYPRLHGKSEAFKIRKVLRMLKDLIRYSFRYYGYYYAKR